MKTKKLLGATTIAAILAMELMIFPATSFAAGATVYRDNWDSGMICSVTPEGFSFCFQQKGAWTRVETPSGNVNYKFKGTAFTSVGIAGNLSQSTIESNDKMLFKVGELHNGHNFTTINIVNSANGECRAYTSEYDYTFANGDVKQDKYSFSYGPC
jgi:hypothetical protein